MLGITRNSIENMISVEGYRAFELVSERQRGKTLARTLSIFLGVLVVALFTPWTQNVQTKGYVTTLQPGQRPQTIHSVIAGQIDSWFVREGDYVAQGDTILFIREIKAEYFDPELLNRTSRQIDAKQQSVDSYEAKAASLERQIVALKQVLDLKLEQTVNKIEQARLKVTSDSINSEAAKLEVRIAQRQFNRTDTLYNQGLKSLTDWEGKRVKLQQSQAKGIEAENKLLASKNELINRRIELSAVQNEYADKIAKAESDKFSALSSVFDGDATVAKMENQFANYSIRSGFYYVTAPQNGYIARAIKTGIGETIKEGDAVVSIMPADYEIAAEVFVRPIDLPLLQAGNEVRLIFDGWPSLVFSGWPDASVGTFAGNIVAIENFADNDGMYRILVAPDASTQTWPSALRPGSGAQAMILLKDVPIGYEIWRQLNGFPPEFYKPQPSLADKSGGKK